ncbi:cupredoxin domain-containing protein [Bacillus sp. JJ722]|uniref:cupredoxin domain-containing protein n=1 Tax=Bacillus sp. JJ722 TaxID=3122973 RepID=UPI00300053A1
MSIFFYFVMVTLSLAFIATVMMLQRYKKRFSSMVGMVLPMVIGTFYGVTTGILFGSLFQGNLFYSTGFSILIGVLVGTSCGLILGIIPSIEGFIAGLMGGMMGAMLGDMISDFQSAIMINIFLTLSVSLLFLLKALSMQPEKESQKYTRKWLLKPFFIFVTLTSYLLLGSHLNKQGISSITNISNENRHVSHQENTQPYKNQLSVVTINVQPSKFSYEPSTIQLKKNQRVSLILNNEDMIDHDIEIKKIPIAKEDTNLHIEHQNLNSDFHLHSSASKQEKITFTPIALGTYEFYCTIPGHKEKGMIGTLTVTK